MTDISGYTISQYEYHLSNVPSRKPHQKRAALYSVNQHVIFEDVSRNEIWVSTPREKARIINPFTTSPVPATRVHKASEKPIVYNLQTALVSQVETTTNTSWKCLPLVLPATTKPQRCNVTEAVQLDIASTDHTVSFECIEVCEPITVETSDSIDFAHLECCATETTIDILESFGTVQPMPTDMPFAEVGENGALLATWSVYKSSIAMGLYMGLHLPWNSFVSYTVNEKSSETSTIHLDHIQIYASLDQSVIISVLDWAEALPCLISSAIDRYLNSATSTLPCSYWAAAEPLTTYMYLLSFLCSGLMICVLRWIIIIRFDHTCSEGGGYQHWA